jgi:hypothetical protein
MKLKSVTSVLLATLFSAAAAQAETGITGTLGSTGVGAHLSVPLQANLNFRTGLNYLNYSSDANTSDVDYELKMKLRTVDALLDYFPMGGSFRISAGLVYNGNKIDAHAKPTGTGTYTVNGNTYLASSVGTLDAKIDFRKSAPYLGIGWGNAAAAGKGWGFSSDIGVIFQGSPSSTLKNNDCVAPTQVCTQLAADLVAENVKLNDEASDFKVYPVIRFGASYRF